MFEPGGDTIGDARDLTSADESHLNHAVPVVKTVSHVITRQEIRHFIEILEIPMCDVIHCRISPELENHQKTLEDDSGGETLKLSKISRRAMLAGASAFGLNGFAPFALAQGLRKKVITIVVPFAAGGSADIMARIICQKMGELLGQSVVFENRGGAGGNIAASFVSKATPDGSTLLWGSIATHAINPAIFKTMPYDPVNDFAAISLTVMLPNVVIVHPSVPAKDVGEMIALLKAEPNKYSYATSGVGTPLHLSGELFKLMSGTEMKHVPVPGSGPALNDVVAGHVPVMFDTLASATQHIQSGALRPLAVTTKERTPAMPDVPTMEESGLRGYETYAWQALFAPPGTPKNMIDQINKAANRAIKDPGVAERLRELGATSVGTTPEQLEAHVKAELAKWAPIAKAAGASME